MDDGPWSNGMLAFWLWPRVWFVFYFIMISDCSLSSLQLQKLGLVTIGSLDTYNILCSTGTFHLQALFEHRAYPYCLAEGYIGINYGRVANNLPRPKEVAKLVKSLGVKHIKIFDYDREVLKAFEKTNIHVTICVPNDQIIGLAKSEKAARTWVHNHVEKRVRKKTKIKFIVVGNEVNNLLTWKI